MDAAAEPLDDLHHIDDSLRSIQYDDGRRYQPLRLDKMFARATSWTSTPQVGPIQRPPTPPRRTAMIYPLPQPLQEINKGVSPLGKLFQYPELVPNILKCFDRPRELATLALVNREFCRLARKRLYEILWIRPWEKGSDIKLGLLFETLHQHPELCKLVKHLDVRFFPLATRDTERYDLDEKVQKAVAAMVELESLIWTRDRSLNNPLVDNIANLRHLRTLEISGHSRRYYDPRVLSRLPALEELRVMMPDATFRDSLLGLVKSFDARSNGGLRGLAVVAKVSFEHLSTIMTEIQGSPLVDDGMLLAMAPFLRDLKRLTFWGCTRLTRDGVRKILTEAKELEELSLDTTSHSNLNDLTQAPPLSELHTLSISFPAPNRLPSRPGLSASDLPSLPSGSRLTSLLLTLSGDRAWMPAGGISHLAVQTDFTKLKRLSLLNLFFGSEELTELIETAPNLEELYLSIRSRNVLLDCDALDKTRLRILHTNAPERWGPTPTDLLNVAERIPTLEQIGTGNRVYQILRRYDKDEPVVEICRWSQTGTPGYFQVWRG
ncbi:hypothetical protein BD324DRAFT_612737 [Kockovaella imperatae]|uniref:F-box domain-containing protein n=1 Tax=Kockovaella imperatae TaxID=4999 RepID=A0A1Y1USI6_9TREE|nr:hypothetical protein BD324DRAFT_612737 [Kockovaella imperatae]ORX40973.1 hypothetical protein BD324DRAFT_612737 [Kockovaella imperatae]